jgi:hypothetical protein
MVPYQRKSKIMTKAPCKEPFAPITYDIGEPEPKSSYELEAMREGMGELIDLLSYARPHDSEGECIFIKDWLLPRLHKAGAMPNRDLFGNVWLEVPSPKPMSPAILWSCHIDTVHKDDGRQGIKWHGDGRTIGLAKRKPGRCLGADDGAGVWLLLQMIRAGVPGGYVFHRGEEAGRLGSLHVARKEPKRLQGYDACIAFDRRDFRDVITHQMGERCASEAFASTLSHALNSSGYGLRYRADDTGSFTDSYSYASIISECTNLSVGYDREHGPSETLDALHLWRLSQAICDADLSAVICERDPSAIDFDSWGDSYGGWRSSYYGSEVVDFEPYLDTDGEDNDALLELIRRYPGAARDLLDLYGLGIPELLEMLDDRELGFAMGGMGA